MIDKRTDKLGLPLPHPENQLSEDVLRIQQSFGLLDTAVFNATEAAGRAQEGATTATEQAAAAQTAAEGAVQASGQATTTAGDAHQTATAARETAEEALTQATQAMQKAGEAAAVQTLLEQAVDMGEAAGDVVLDGKQGRVFTATLTAATTFSVINTEPGACLLLELHNAGAQVVTWAMLPRWAGGVAPLLAAAGSDLVALTHGNEGWYGVHVAADAR